MSDQGVRKVMAIILIVIGAIIVIGVLGMWLMHSMMGGMMGSMAGSMMGCMAMCFVGPLLLAGVLVVLGIVLLQHRARNGGTQ
jgi:hypothetical protein